jgi:iron complex outermembrane receptor protein
MRTSHQHRFGDVNEQDRHTTLFLETSLRGQSGAHLWAAGAALERNAYSSTDVSGFDYTHDVPSLFAQDEITFSPRLSLSVSGRIDAHNEFGTFASPRASLLLRPAGSWTVRLSAGGGYYAPTPFTEETEEVGLSRVVPPAGLRAERARSFSADVGTDVRGVEIHATVFHSNVEHALAVRPSITMPGRAELINLDGATRTSGTELLVRYRREPFGITASHTFVDAREPALAGGRRTVPHTPRHSAGLVAVYEVHGEGRAGLELYYTGRQPLEDNPYRTTSRPYVILGLLFEKRFGRVRAFLNLENVTDVRQTRWQPTVLPQRGEYGRWTVDTWAPLDGRVFNGGVRIAW